MMWTTIRRSLAAALLGAVAACGALDVSDPTAIEDDELNNAAGAELLRTDVISQMYRAIGLNASVGGFLTDELFSDPPAYYATYGIVSASEMLDRRESVQAENVMGGGVYGFWQELRYGASNAIAKMRAYGVPGAAEARAGELLAIRGFAALNLAETVCPGVPLHAVVAYKPIFGRPLTTTETFEHALVDLDSALAEGADSARVVKLASLFRGRALLGLGRFAEAAAAVTDVETSYRVEAEYDNANDNTFNPLALPARYDYINHSVANQEGGVGLDYVTANDPRLPTDSIALAADSTTVLSAATKYSSPTSPIVYASGIEARLIEAEAALAANDPSWRTILNDLRQNNAPTPMTPLPDPGTADARLDLLFHERAFWLFGTGHRLGDLRRLIALYGRTADGLYPSGTYHLGGNYGTATSVPFNPTSDRAYNAAITGCMVR